MEAIRNSELSNPLNLVTIYRNITLEKFFTSNWALNAFKPVTFNSPFLLKIDSKRVEIP